MFFPITVRCARRRSGDPLLIERPLKVEIASMSLKPSPHRGDIYARECDHIASLKAVYPHQFPGRAWSYSWPDGWHRLVTEACAGLNHLRPDAHWLQIKEKYAGLRLYYSESPVRLDLQTSEGVICTDLKPSIGSEKHTDLDKLIIKLEAASRETCSLCGGMQGIGRSTQFGTWWLTACEACEPLIRGSTGGALT